MILSSQPSAHIVNANYVVGAGHFELIHPTVLHGFCMDQGRFCMKMPVLKGVLALMGQARTT